MVTFVLSRENEQPAKLKVRTYYYVLCASEDTTNVSRFFNHVPDISIDYPFTLDMFQILSVHRLESDEIVFVASHTSAGKTSVSNYSTSIHFQRNTKVLCPLLIKTFNRNKFRELT